MRLPLYISVICITIFFLQPIKAQQLLNGGFEEIVLDSSLSFFPEHFRPEHWSISVTLDPMTGCTEYTGEMTNDSHSGEWAVKLETIYCQGALFPGALATLGDPDDWNFYTGPAHIIDARPDQISFYHKYQPVGGDTAKYGARLFNFPDSISAWDPEFPSYLEIIGEAEGLIIEPADEYTQLALNIDYFYDEVPKYITVYFTTNHHNFEVLPAAIAHAGTTLWIDDVELIYLSTSSEETRHQPDVRLYPNPTTDLFRIELEQDVMMESIQMHDFSGRLVKNLNPQEAHFNISDLPAGMYFVTVYTDQGSAVKKLVKE